MKRLGIALLVGAAMSSSAIQAEMHGQHDHDKSMTVTMHKVTAEGTSESIGTVKITQNKHGLVFEPSLKDLTPGRHGFHVHENPSCQPSGEGDNVTPGGAAGSHYDPKDSGAHGTPWGDGHLGDIPALHVSEDGSASFPVLAPRLKLKDLKGRSLMIHAQGDNYSDDPKPLGGGGARVACGVFEKH